MCNFEWVIGFSCVPVCVCAYMYARVCLCVFYALCGVYIVCMSIISARPLCWSTATFRAKVIRPEGRREVRAAREEAGLIGVSLVVSCMQAWHRELSVLNVGLALHPLPSLIQSQLLTNPWLLCVILN